MKFFTLSRVVLIVSFLFSSAALAQESTTFRYDPREHRSKYADLLSPSPSSVERGTMGVEPGWDSRFTVPGVVHGPLFALATDGVNLYVGGQFSAAGGVRANNVAKWDGVRWSSIGTGNENGVNGTVEGITFLNGKLYVGGQISKAGTRPVNGIAVWDGVQWSGLGNDSLNGVRDTSFVGEQVFYSPGHVYAVGQHQNLVMIGGRFKLAGTTVSNGVAAWNTVTNSWVSLQTGLRSPYEGDQVYAFSFASAGDTLYVGGKFFMAGNVPAKNIAQWTGTSWSEVGGGANNWVMDITVDSARRLYVGGHFDTVGTTRVRGVARWDGSSWSTFGTGIDPSTPSYFPVVRAIRVIDGSVYVGGYFLEAGTTAVRSVARWNGSSWQTMTTGANNVGSPFTSTINTMEVIGSTLFVGGYHNSVDSLTVSAVSAWNHHTQSWSALNDGSGSMGIYGGGVEVLTATPAGTYAGGDFRIAGGKQINRIARWNGTVWSAVGSGPTNGVNGYVNAIAVDGDSIYIGGGFSIAGSVQTFHVAYWNGTEWKGTGFGVGGVSGAKVNAVVKHGRHIYVGGYFSVAGDMDDPFRAAMSVARFNLDTERWEPLGGGIESSSGVPGTVYSLVRHNGKLYAGGSFSYAGLNPATNVAVWNDTAWTYVGPAHVKGITGVVISLASTEQGITAGGRFSGIGERVSLARWNGSDWMPMLSPMSYKNGQGIVLDVQYHHGRYYVGGQFDNIGGAPVSNLAVIDGDSWIDLGIGLDGPVYAAAAKNDRLMIGGTFTMVGGIPSVSVGEFSGIPTAVPKKPVSFPSAFHLHQNYPNPFNPSTTIGFTLPVSGHTTVNVYDLIGREVATLVNGYREAGTLHRVPFHASFLPSGIYIVRLSSGGKSESRKMVLMK